MRSTGTRRGTGTGLGLVAVLVVGAIALLVGANRWSGAGDGLLPGGDGATGPAGPAGPSATPTPPPSGWAPVTLAEVDDAGDGINDLGGTRDEVALATLAGIVARAPVVVTTPTTSGHVFDGARALARRLQAPLVLADGRSDRETDNGETTSASPAAGTSAIPTSASPATGPGTSSAMPSPSGEVMPTSVADLLVEWGTSHVVAVAGRPVVHAAGAPAIHDVAVVSTDPPARADASSSPSANGPTSVRTTSQSTMPVGTESPSRATASVSPGMTAGVDDPLHELRLPDTVTAMLDDADTAEPVADRPPAVVVRAPDDGQPRLRPDAAATVRALGGDLVEWGTDDPRRDADLRDALREVASGAWLLAVADRDRPAPVDAAWAELVQAAAVAPELPGGGLTLFPGRVFVASYGNPAGPALGVLGERDVQGSIEFTKGLAAEYEGLFGEGVQVQPAFEIIVTVASSQPEEGDYSRRADLDIITEWVDAATEAGLYVMLDLQPGRTDFLTQAKEVEQLLTRPNVGLALDPEWRLEPDEVHLEQIGSVTTAEVNEVSAWLAGLVRDHDLPQKLLIIHNFRLAMLTDRHDLVDHPELATMVHVDGQGAQESKDGTYENITSAGPDFLWWGWKNFYDEDVPGIRSPEDTAAVSPQPNFISYQ